MLKRFVALLLLAAVGSVFFALMLGYTPDAELNQTARYYAERTAADLGAANIVTAIVVTYRGLDTLGEVTVLFLAATIVGLVLARDSHAERRPRAPVGELLTTGTRFLVPLILLLGAYVFVNGHLTPGGGFQGGAIVGGYHATHPFGGVSGFAAFCLATPHSTNIRVLSQPSYGASGAKDLRLRVQDAQQRDLVVVPGG